MSHSLSQKTTIPETILVPKTTIFKSGAAAVIEKNCKIHGVKGYAVYGTAAKNNKSIIDFFRNKNVRAVQRVNSSIEPSTAELEEMISDAQKWGAQWILGIGGGSILDLAKATAGLFNALEPPRYYQTGGILGEKGIPFIAVPTTAGSGAEATPNAVFIHTETNEKLSIRENTFIAETVILDPDLLSEAPPQVIAGSGLDAFAQAIESYFSLGGTWLSSVYAYQAFECIVHNLVPFYKTRTHDHACGLLLGSYLAGIALSQSRLGVVHGIAHPLGVRYGIEHGKLCGWILPHALALNKEYVPDKYASLSAACPCEDLYETACMFLRELQITNPFPPGPYDDDDSIISAALSSGSTRANPFQITEKEMRALLDKIRQQ